MLEDKHAEQSDVVQGFRVPARELGSRVPGLGIYRLCPSPRFLVFPKLVDIHKPDNSDPGSLHLNLVRVWGCPAAAGTNEALHLASSLWQQQTSHLSLEDLQTTGPSTNNHPKCCFNTRSAGTIIHNNISSIHSST